MPTSLGRSITARTEPAYDGTGFDARTRQKLRGVLPRWARPPMQSAERFLKCECVRQSSAKNQYAAQSFSASGYQHPTTLEMNPKVETTESAPW